MGWQWTYPLANMSNADTWSFSRSVSGCDFESIIIVLIALSSSLLSRTELPAPISSKPLAITCPIATENNTLQVELYSTTHKSCLFWTRLTCTHRDPESLISLKFLEAFHESHLKDLKLKAKKKKQPKPKHTKPSQPALDSEDNTLQNSLKHHVCHHTKTPGIIQHFPCYELQVILTKIWICCF